MARVTTPTAPHSLPHAHAMATAAAYRSTLQRLREVLIHPAEAVHTFRLDRNAGGDAKMVNGSNVEWIREALAQALIDARHNQDLLPEQIVEVTPMTTSNGCSSGGGESMDDNLRIEKDLVRILWALLLVNERRRDQVPTTIVATSPPPTPVRSIPEKTISARHWHHTIHWLCEILAFTCVKFTVVVHIEQPRQWPRDDYVTHLRSLSGRTRALWSARAESRGRCAKCAILDYDDDDNYGSSEDATQIVIACEYLRLYRRWLRRPVHVICGRHSPRRRGSTTFTLELAMCQRASELDYRESPPHGRYYSEYKSTVAPVWSQHVLAVRALARLMRALMTEMRRRAAAAATATTTTSDDDDGDGDDESTLRLPMTTEFFNCVHLLPDAFSDDDDDGFRLTFVDATMSPYCMDFYTRRRPEPAYTWEELTTMAIDGGDIV